MGRMLAALLLAAACAASEEATRPAETPRATAASEPPADPEPTPVEEPPPDPVADPAPELAADRVLRVLVTPETARLAVDGVEVALPYEGPVRPGQVVRLHAVADGYHPMRGELTVPDECRRCFIELRLRTRPRNMLVTPPPDPISGVVMLEDE